ncbi:hypothetical protein PanWU01x14_230280 [Parasponia andersonii]|uniref:Uncharacterized protein n=1 Tax=Parasponia andersonii TaxID=3476 RepID=A0A2P5BL03_PARAD|nr:hypothetical protein PanWU01x14_230280 [Parasponia andersonii]
MALPCFLSAKGPTQRKAQTMIAPASLRHHRKRLALNKCIQTWKVQARLYRMV